VVVVDDDAPDDGMVAVVRSVVVVLVTLSGLPQPATKPVLAHSATAVKNRRREVLLVIACSDVTSVRENLLRRAWSVDPPHDRGHDHEV
jgi:hypothetical protein